MRVCIVTHKVLLTDGQGRINLEIARHLALLGNRVTLIATEVDPMLLKIAGIDWRRVPIPSALPTALLRYQAFAVGALAAIASDCGEFDIVQLNGAITYMPCDVNIAMFVHSHWNKSAYHPGKIHRNAYGAYQRLFTTFNAAWERRAFRVAKRVVALSRPVADSLIEDVGLSRDRVETIEPGVDPLQFRPLHSGETNTLRELLKISDDSFILFFAGDIRSNRKNLDLVLSVMPDLDEKVHLAVAGTTEGSPYPAMAQKSGLAARVHFLGHRRDVATLLRGADAFVFPSHYDTFALVVTEAMASGIPTITAAHVGAASSITDGETGFLLRDSSDRAGLLNRIRQLRNDQTFKKQMGAAGRESVIRYTWKTMAERYRALYAKIADEKTCRMQQ